MKFHNVAQARWQWSATALLCTCRSVNSGPIRSHFDGERVGKSLPLLKNCRNTYRNAVPIVEVFNNALWKALQTIFRPKCVARFCIYNFQMFPGGAYIQTPVKYGTI